MRYKNNNGYPVADFGWTIIEGVSHLVKNGWVVCDPSLNHKAWNVTNKKTICPDCAKHVELKQLKLWNS